MSLERKRSRYGLIFLAPWIVGMLLFFLYPIFQSIYYSFCRLDLSQFGVETTFLGTEQYYKILHDNPTYMADLGSAVQSFFVTLPFILVVSLILALCLNENFRGRLFFRALFFVPVILSSGPALKQFLAALF